MTSAWGDEGDIRYRLQKRDGGGWDITGLEVKGRNALELQKGEFATQEEAKKAAIEKGRDFEKLG